MKKLVLAALLAGSMCAMAEEAAKTMTATEAAATVEKVRKARPQLTEEQKAQMKARREKFLAARKARQAEMRAKMLETIKKYVPDEAKAKALMEELEKLTMGMRRPGGRPPASRPAAKPAAEK